MFLIWIIMMIYHINCFANHLTENWILGDQCLKNGDYESAVHHFSSCLDSVKEIDPAVHYDILMDKGKSHLLNQDYERAQEDFQTVLSFLPNSTSPYRLIHYIKTLKELGATFIKQGEFQQAQAVIYQLRHIKNSLIAKQIGYLPIKYSEEEIQQEEEAAEQELQKFYNEAYETAKQIMQFDLGEATDHLIQAGEHAIEAWQHCQEVERMHRENRRQK